MGHSLQGGDEGFLHSHVDAVDLPFQNRILFCIFTPQQCDSSLKSVAIF